MHLLCLTHLLVTLVCSSGRWRLWLDSSTSFQDLPFHSIFSIHLFKHEVLFLINLFAQDTFFEHLLCACMGLVTLITDTSQPNLPGWDLSQGVDACHATWLGGTASGRVADNGAPSLALPFLCGSFGWSRWAEQNSFTLCTSGTITCGCAHLDTWEPHLWHLSSASKMTQSLLRSLNEVFSH